MTENGLSEVKEARLATGKAPETMRVSSITVGGVQYPNARIEICERDRAKVAEAIAETTQGTGFKYDAGKPRMALLPFDALTWVGKVLTFGAAKYKAHSWRTVPDAQERYTNALLRHVGAWLGGEWLDPESGLPHVAHIACNGLFICALACAENKVK